MMLRRLLDRYIFTELLSPFMLSLGVLCFVVLSSVLLVRVLRRDHRARFRTAEVRA